MTTTSRRAAGPVDATASPQARWRTLPAGAVTIDGGIWAKRQAVNRASALPHGFRMLEQAGNFENLKLAASDATEGYRGPVFMDSDVYKWIEAASLELSRQPSADLEALIEQAIDVDRAGPEGRTATSTRTTPSPSRGGAGSTSGTATSSTAPATSSRRRWRTTARPAASAC